MQDADRHDAQRLARDDLRRYRQAKRDIEQMQELIQHQRDKALQASAPADTGVRVQSSGNRSEDLMVSIADLALRYQQRQAAAERLCMEIEQRISERCEGVEARILRWYYLYGQTFEWIAVKESYSYRWIMKMHWNALLRYGKRVHISSH